MSKGGLDCILQQLMQHPLECEQEPQILHSGDAAAAAEAAGDSLNQYASAKLSRSTAELQVIRFYINR
jgi:hypothetical protein